MVDSLFSLGKYLIAALMMVSFGIYEGAAIIALIAALSRIAYTQEKASLKLFIKFLTMSLAITMGMVHVGSMLDWDKDLLVIISGISAFLCREFFEAVMNSKGFLFKRFFGGLR